MTEIAEFVFGASYKTFLAALAIAATASALYFILTGRTPERRFYAGTAAFTLVLFAAYIAFLLMAPPDAASDQKSVVYLRQEPDSRSLIVFLHGWRGDATTWRQLAELAQQDPDLTQANIVIINYVTHMARNNLPINDLADWIGVHLARIAGNRNVYIVAHSLGGVAGRQLLVHNHNSGSPVRIRLLVSIASPFQGANSARLATLLGLYPGLLETLVPGSRYLRSLAADWARYRDARAPEAARHLCIAAGNDDVVIRESAIADCDSRPIVYPAWGHQDAIIPSTSSDERYIIPIKLVATALKHDEAR